MRARWNPVGNRSNRRKSRRSISSFAPQVFQQSRHRDRLGLTVFSEEEREDRVARIVPDFVIELRSKSDNLRKLRNKMSEYIESGVRLGWLIDPYERRVHIYRADQSVEVLENPQKVSGEDVLSSFELDLREIW
ncbi:MAG: hypothetical protein DMF76_18265 [Acidobacteria bacterium]|nr:MAG: hypothetical protein DMF76_18265 [Acidobacteriota bacterium]